MAQLYPGDISIIQIPALSINSPLIDSLAVTSHFGESEDNIELHIYDFDNYDAPLISEPQFFDFTIPETGETTTEISLDPQKILNDRNFLQGKYRIVFNVIRKKIFNLPNFPFIIKEISPSRTEIRALTPNIQNTTLDSTVSNFITEIETSVYFKQFILNFGENVSVVGINVLLNKNPEKHEVLFKLHDPLPSSISNLTAFEVAEFITDPITIEVDLGEIAVNIPSVELKGPNFKIETRQNNSIPTDYKTYDELLNYQLTSSYEHLLSELEDKDIPNIQYDYVPSVSGSLEGIEEHYHFENFVHFSSAVERLNNFEYKIKLIEEYDKQINQIDNAELGDAAAWQVLSGSIYVGKTQLYDKKEKLIKGFDGYEKFLYFESGTFSWPKENAADGAPTLKPYTLKSIGSTEVKTWLGSFKSENPNFGGQLLSASLFDKSNYHSLLRSIPEHIISNTSNNYYLSFVNMIGQHFDYIWTYIKHLSKLSDGHHTRGISKDLVYNQLKSLGIETFDQFENTSLLDYILGYSSGSAYYGGNHKFLTGSTGPSSETFVTSSNQGSIPKGDITKEIWKRLYHNVPYLLKTKGTERGLRALMSCYGVPSTILNIKEYGGSVKDPGASGIDPSTNYKTFNYEKSGLALKGATFDPEGNDFHYRYFLKVPWSSSFTTFNNLSEDDQSDHGALGSPTGSNAKTVEFRIKPVRSANRNYHLFNLSSSRADLDPQLILNPYTGADISSSGDSKNYGKIDLYLDGALTASTANFPVFNGDFWNIFIGVEGEGEADTDTGAGQVGTNNLKFGAYQSNFLGNVSNYSASVNIFEVSRSATWGMKSSSGKLLDGTTDGVEGGATYAYFGGIEPNNSPKTVNETLKYSGSIQEVRFYYGEHLSHDTLEKHAKEPFMYAGNTVSSSYENLVLRLPLGSNDKRDSGSFHPNINVNYLEGEGAYVDFTFANLNMSNLNFAGAAVSKTVVLTSVDGTVKKYRRWTSGITNEGFLANGEFNVETGYTYQNQGFDEVIFISHDVSQIDAGNENAPPQPGNLIAIEFAKAVNHENGHNGKIIATVEGATVRLTQKVQGSIGNEIEITTQDVFGTMLLGGTMPSEFSFGKEGISSNIGTSLDWGEVVETHHLPTPDTVGVTMTSEKVRIDEGVVDQNMLHLKVKSETSTHDRQPLDAEDLGVFFSPTTEINEDIIYTLGAFRLDDYIGNPLASAQTASEYTDLISLRNTYAQKVERRYNYWDYIKLVQQIDHTLFKMIEQWVPAKANLKTGLLIEPHYLERTKFPRQGFPHRSDGQTMITGSHQTFEVFLNKKQNVLSIAQSLTGSMGGGQVLNRDGSGSRFQNVPVVTTNNMIRPPYGPITVLANGIGECVIGSSFFVGISEPINNTLSIERPEGFEPREQGTNFTLTVTTQVSASNDICQGPIIPRGPKTFGWRGIDTSDTIIHNDSNYRIRKSSVLLGNAVKGKISRKYYRHLGIGNASDIDTSLG